MLDPLYKLVARGIVVFHDALAPVFGQNSFLSYALAIVLIVMIVRLLIFPLFIRSVKAQRSMQLMQPRMKEIREKYKNDKPRMNQELMALQKEHGNPLLGCLPLVLQIPLFISLFHVFNKLAPRTGSRGLDFYGTSGLSRLEVQHIATAKLGGVSLASAFTSSKNAIDLLGTSQGAVRVVAVVLILLMSATTFVTQKQIMSRGGPVDPQQQQIQRIMLYGSPIMLAVFGFRFPVAVLLYWLTTNLWSMGQQYFIIRKMGPGPVAGAGAPGPSKSLPPSRPDASAGDEAKSGLSLRKRPKAAAPQAAPTPAAATPRLVQKRVAPAAAARRPAGGSRPGAGAKNPRRGRR